MFSNFRVANAEGGHVTLSQAHFDDLHATLQRMQLVVDESNATLKQYHIDMESMRKVSLLLSPVDDFYFIIKIHISRRP